MLSSILSKLRPKCQPEQQHTPEVDHTQSASALCQLPTDILLTINNALPLPSQVCLIMTCQKITFLLGNKCTAVLQTMDRQDDERKRFLRLLAKDCPPMLPCYLCMKLHKPERLLKKSKCRDYAGFTDIFALRKYHRFRYAHVQLFMGLHEKTAGHDQLLSQIPRRERNILTTLDHPVETHMYGIKMILKLKVVDKRLLARLQVRYTKVINGETGKLPWDLCYYMQSFLSLLEANTCRHSDPKGFRYGPVVFPLWLGAYHFCRMKPSSTVYRENSILRRCIYCATETEFCMEVSRGGTSSLMITCWKDLGSGQDPTEESWNSHSRYRRRYIPEPSSQQSIKEAFEGTGIVTPSQRTLHLSIEPFPPHGSLSTDVNRTEFLLRTAGS